MSTAPLAHRLAGLHDLALQRSVVAERAATLGAAGFAAELEPLLARAAERREPEQRVMLSVASWVAHALARGEAAGLCAIGAAAAGADLPFTSAMFAPDAPRAALARGARLAEVGIAVFANLSGLPWRRSGQTAEDWQQQRAWCLRSPVVRRFMVRALAERAPMHHDPVFIGRLLDQPWIWRHEVVAIAARRPTVPAILLAVATRDRWLRFAQVREAIAENPYAPRPLARALASRKVERPRASLAPRVPGA